MNMCRTCLEIPAVRDISELEKDINEDNKNYLDIMEFCLNIKVKQDSKITTKLCNNCYRKIISFYKFKAISLKNNVYLQSLDPAVLLAEKNISVYVDENGIKHENLLDTDEYGPVLLVDEKPVIKIEIDVKNEVSLEDPYLLVSDEQLPSEEQRLNENIQNETEENAAIATNKQCAQQNKNVPDEISENIKEKQTPKIRKKRDCRKKVKQPNKHSKNDYEMCEECGKSYRNLKEHIIRHQPKDQRPMLRCKICPKLFFTKHGQNYHYKTAHLGIKSTCDICNKEVVSLSVHKLQVHDKDSLPFSCVSCTHRFISQSALDSHMTCHTKVYVYECDDCQMKFRQKQALSRHIRQVHNKERRFQCEFCSKGYLMKSALKAHLRSHTKERPYECEECGKSFSLSTTLNSHRLIHGDDKKFRCNVCDMTFKKAGYLSAHMISHTKEKRHPCQYCGVRFGRSDHRRRHEFTAHQKHLAND